MNMYNRVLLIGGAGFIGSHTAKLLKANGYSVDIVDNFSTSTQDAFLDEFDIYKIDAADIEELRGVYKKTKPEAVFIFSSVVDVYSTIKNPLLVMSGIQSIINASQLSFEFGVKLNVYASSGFVYGNKNELPYMEGSTLDPVNPYNISKIFGEDIVNFYSREYSLNSIILRYAPTYGPRRNIGPIIDYIHKAINSEPITLYGNVTRDYIYVEDVAYANMMVLQKTHGKSRVFNIGTGVEVNLKEVYLEICNILKIKPREIIENESKSAEINRFCLNIDCAKNELGFTHNHSLNQGLSKTIDSVIKVKSV